eukprot:13868559-Heterocapsa_arctica.AAC.1
MQDVSLQQPPHRKSVCGMPRIWHPQLGEGSEGKRGLSALSGKGGLSTPRESGTPGQGKGKDSETEARTYETNAEECGGNAGMGRQSGGNQSGHQKSAGTEQCGTRNNQGTAGSHVSPTSAMEGPGKER